MSACATCGKTPKRGHARYCCDDCEKALEGVLVPMAALLEADENGDVALRARTRLLLRFVHNWLGSRRGFDVSATKLAAALESVGSLLQEAEKAEQSLLEASARRRKD